MKKKRTTWWAIEVTLVGLYMQDPDFLFWTTDDGRNLLASEPYTTAYFEDLHTTERHVMLFSTKKDALREINTFDDPQGLRPVKVEVHFKYKVVED